MGQAKRRGTFEERKAKAIKRNSLNADHLEALGINKHIDTMDQIIIKNENGDYKKRRKYKSNPLLRIMTIAGIISATSPDMIDVNDINDKKRS